VFGVVFVIRLPASQEVEWLRGICPRYIMRGFWQSDLLILIVLEVTVRVVVIIPRGSIIAEVVIKILGFCL